MNNFSNNEKEKLFSTTMIVIISFTLAKLLLHIVTIQNYGIFRDEFYYLACADYVDFGYVDHPPLSIWILSLIKSIFGDSIFALRIFPAIIGSLTVFISGIIAKELGGKIFSIIISMIAVIISPLYLALHHYYSMNSIDILIWTVSFFLLIKIIKTEKPKYWILLGFCIGLGILNKLSPIFLCFGLFIGLIFTNNRKFFFTKWLWICLGIALLFFIPYLIWNVTHNFASLEFMKNASLYKNYKSSPLEYILGQIINMNPVTFPLWIFGIIFFLISKNNSSLRIFGITYLTILVVFILTSGKTYYLSPIYTILFAGGAIFIENIFIKFQKIKIAILGVLMALGLLVIPFGLPILPVDTFINYSKKTGFIPPKEEKNKQNAILPSHFQDMFGWEEMTLEVVKVYNTLSSDEKANCIIYGENYGEAGAIKYFGKKYNICEVVSGHNNFYYWFPENKKVDVVIAIVKSQKKESFESVFEEVTEVSKYTTNYYSSMENNLSIYLCKKPKYSMKELKEKIKKFI
ncbi:MAG: hypothetical protein A2Y34_12740 [Spirochaetes bacterium GWC1_27_15]|nr:MAG: hypothetical protein A2Z98_00240 [Spirochaetes bacterium GWB1_27_13]OHD20834.1 MAG: hypothetical protein A2Y34_12740 [Spirochaetes bacterium GWC1_27_15]